MPTHVEHHRMPALSRRQLLGGFLIGLASGGALGRRASAAPVYEVYATTTWDRAVQVRKKLSRPDKLGAAIPAGTTVRVLAGPTDEGWYNVQSTVESKVVGWLAPDEIVFTQTARLTADATIYAGPGDWSAALATLPAGYVVELRGAPTDGYVFVRSGERTGWTALATLETTTSPPTDPWAERWIDVNRSTLQVSLMLGDTALNSYPASMSAETGDGFYSTAPGSYSISQKQAELHYTPYANAYIMYWAGFDPGRANGFHSWTMDAAGNVIPGGDGFTGGCVATSPELAAAIFDFAAIGMRVEVHW